MSINNPGTGPSTRNLGELFVTIEGKVALRTYDGERLGKFSVYSDSTVVYATNSYDRAYDYCFQQGLTPVDCTR